MAGKKIYYVMDCSALMQDNEKKTARLSLPHAGNDGPRPKEENVNGR